MWIFNQPSGIEIIKRPRQVAVGDTKHPAALFTLWTDAERAAIGIYPASYVDSAPTGEHKAGEETAVLVDGKGEVSRKWIEPDLEGLRSKVLEELNEVRLAKTLALLTIAKVEVAYAAARDDIIAAKSVEEVLLKKEKGELRVEEVK